MAGVPYLPLVFQITPSDEARRVCELMVLPASAKGTSRPAMGDPVSEIKKWLPPFIESNRALSNEVPLVIVINAHGDEFGIPPEAFSEVGSRARPTRRTRPGRRSAPSSYSARPNRRRADGQCSRSRLARRSAHRVCPMQRRHLQGQVGATARRRA